MNRKYLATQNHSPSEYQQNRAPFQDISNGYISQLKKPSMFTKIKNQIAQEKQIFKDQIKHDSNSQDHKSTRTHFSRDPYDSHKQQDNSIPKFSYEDTLKERNYFKKQNSRLQSQLRIVLQENRELVNRVGYLRDNQKSHIQQISRKNKQGKAIQDFYDILRKENDRLSARNQQLQILNSGHLMELNTVKELSCRLSYLQQLNDKLFQKVKQLQTQ